MSTTRKRADKDYVRVDSQFWKYPEIHRLSGLEQVLILYLQSNPAATALTYRVSLEEMAKSIGDDPEGALVLLADLERGGFISYALPATDDWVDVVEVTILKAYTVEMRALLKAGKGTVERGTS